MSITWDSTQGVETSSPWEEIHDESPPAAWEEVVLGALNALAAFLVLFTLFVALGNPRGVGIGRWRRFGKYYFVHVVTSGSMSPTIRAGDMVVTVPPRELRPGMIAAFQLPDGRTVLHRIVRITEEGHIITKGDANEESDRWFEDGQEYLLTGVPAVYSGIRFPKVGYAVNALGSLGEWGAKLASKLLRGQAPQARSLLSPAHALFRKSVSVTGDFEAGYWASPSSPGKPKK